MGTDQNTATAGSRRNGRLAARRLGGAAVATALMLGLPANARAQSADVARLQAESDAFNAQLRSLEKKMPPAPTRAGADRPAPDARQPPIFADKRLHLGGITITPGGFLAVDQLAHDH
ncbi:hypothetical protein [Methylovirgula sp. HY1]|uniref:hypothetical protein n=1 Tax=Methylovirgula sp. HY1 TaxID=2822761 RepID=UPI001C5B0E9B|nr:hypothetical protein [Methylovirgula sp. HY1]QXX74441.1 hypothetical protein MHY1_01253 [Methylovirgula sp. HY1]